MAAAVEQRRLRAVLRGPEYAFAIPHGDLDALDEVVELCCDIWNGAGSLILPVSAKGRVAGGNERFLQARGVDECFLHPALPGGATENLQALGLTVARFSPRHIREQNLHPLTLQPGYSDPARRGTIVLPDLDESRFKRLIEVLWGRIDDEDRAEYDKAFEIYTSRGASAWTAIIDSQIELTSVLGQSSYLMGPYQGTWRWDSRVLFVFDRGTFNELVRFWNMRSRLPSFSGSGRIVGLPRQALRIPETLSRLRQWASGEAFEAMKPDLEVAPWGKRGLAAVDRLEEAGFRRQPAGASHTSFTHGHVPAERQQLEYGSYLDMIGDFRRGILFDTVAGLGEGENLVRFTPPSEFRPRFGHIVRLVLLNVPLAFPLNTPAAQRIHHNASAGIDGLTLRISNHGRPFDLPLRLPTPDEAIQDYLSPHQLRGALSQPGRYAQALLRRLGGLDRLDGLASDEAVAIVDELTPRSAKKLAQYVRSEVLEHQGDPAAITDETLMEILNRQELYLELPAKTLGELSGNTSIRKIELAPALAQLVAAGLIVRGASLRCPHCNYPDFFLLQELDEQLVCRGCRLTFILPVVDRGGRDEQPMHYRLDGLMAQAMDQDLLPVLLLVRRLIASTPETVYWPGLDLFRRESQQSEAEIDLLHAKAGQIMISECKRRAESLTPQEVNRRVALANELGARPVFAALDGDFPAEVRQIIAESDGYLLDRPRLFGLDNSLQP